jgi:superfamily I DNA/RNA helicase
MPINLEDISQQTTLDAKVFPMKTFFSHLTGSATSSRGAFNKLMHTPIDIQNVWNDTLLLNNVADYQVKEIESMQSLTSKPYRATSDTLSIDGRMTSFLPNLDELHKYYTTPTDYNLDRDAFDFKDVNKWELVENGVDGNRYIRAFVTFVLEMQVTKKDNSNTKDYFYNPKTIYASMYLPNDIDAVDGVIFESSDKTSVGQIKTANKIYVYASRTHSFNSPLIHERFEKSDISSAIKQAANDFIYRLRDQHDEFFDSVDKGNRLSNQELASLVANVQDASIKMKDIPFDIEFYLEYNKRLSDTFTQMGIDETRQQNIRMHDLRLAFSGELAAIKVLKEENKLHFVPKKSINKVNKSKAPYNQAQMQIVQTDEPLAVATAGAGTGKSTTIKGRLDYMEYVYGKGNLSNTLVLSFMNVAAETINRKFPNVKSITFANMVKEIYDATMGEHRLSTVATMLNSMKMLDFKKPAFQKYTQDVIENTTSELMVILKNMDNSSAPRRSKYNVSFLTSQLYITIAENFELVKTILDELDQTILEMQPLIIYAMMTNPSLGTINVPTRLQNIEHIITDESQDISTFEYTILLNLTRQYQSSLLIVGDALQTLFEFRNADPRFLNTIEASGVFKMYKLMSNYRSNQTILDYANKWAGVIDANEYANLKLYSKNLTKPTLKEFNKRVRLLNVEIQKVGDSRKNIQIESMKHQLSYSQGFEEWVMSRYLKKEQIALLAYRHDELNAMIEIVEGILKRNGVDDTVQNISNRNKKPMQNLSKALEAHKREFLTTPITAAYLTTMKATILTDVISNFKDPSRAFVPTYVTKALDEMTTNNIFNQSLQNIGTTITIEEFLEEITEFLINKEIQANTMDKVLKRQQHQDVDWSNKGIIGSTIHGMKGLEVDHTIVVYNEASPKHASQETLRLFYVALTRAKESELIINTYKTNAKGTRHVHVSELGMSKTPAETALKLTRKEYEPTAPQTQPLAIPA